MRSIKRIWVLRKNECSGIPGIFSNAPAVVKSNILMLFSYPSYLKTSPEKRYQETQPFRLSRLSVRTAEGSFFFFPPETKLCSKSTTFRKSIHFSEIKCALAFSREQFSLIWTLLLRTCHLFSHSIKSSVSRDKRDIPHKEGEECSGS